MVELDCRPSVLIVYGTPPPHGYCDPEEVWPRLHRCFAIIPNKRPRTTQKWID